MANGVITDALVRRRERKDAQKQAFQQAMQKDRETAVNESLEFASIAERAAETGQVTPEQFEQFQVGSLQALQRHASTLDQNRQLAVQQLENAPKRKREELAAKVAQLPTGEKFINEQLPMLESRFQAAQARAEQAMQEQQQVETLEPEQATELGFPEGAIVQKEPDGTLSLAFDPSESMSSLQERVAAIMASGVEDEERALGIASGRYQVSVNPTTNERVVFDLATGEPIGNALPERDPSAVPSMLPDNIDSSLSTGFPGAFRNVVNILGDAAGAGTAFPRAQEATEALSSLQLFTTTTMQAEVPGRPSNFLLERLENLTVSPNSLLQGEDRSRTRLEQTQRLIDGEIARLENDVLPLELPPNTRVETQLNLTQLKRLSEAYEGVIGSFDQTGEVDSELQELLDRYAPEGE